MFNHILSYDITVSNSLTHLISYVDKLIHYLYTMWFIDTLLHVQTVVQIICSYGLYQFFNFYNYSLITWQKDKFISVCQSFSDQKGSLAVIKNINNEIK